MGSQTAEVDKERELSSQQLRFQRQKIYRSKVPHSSVFPCVNGITLPPAPESKRKSNFLKFIELFFYKKIYTNTRDPFSDSYQEATKLQKSSDGFKAFARFSDTDYGSSVVKEMIDNQMKYKDFKIKEGTGNAAIAEYNTILLPSTFPYQQMFITSGQRVYDLAIIYHEFAHTSVFRNVSSQGKIIGVHDERMAVMLFENPVRIKHGYEPRYSYTMRDGSFTINIITGKKAVGKCGVSKYDPTRLVKLSDKDILK